MEILLRQKIIITEDRIYTDGELKFSQFQKIPLLRRCFLLLWGVPIGWLGGEI